MEYYSALEDEILPHVTWMNLEDVMGNEITQIQKHKYQTIPSIEVLRFIHLLEKESRWGPREKGGTEGHRCSAAVGFWLREMN